MILPPVGPSFAWENTRFGPALVCRPILPWARHLFTTHAWALGSRRAGPGERAQWEQISGYFGNTTSVSRLRQVHGNRAVRADPQLPELPDADIIVTLDPALVIAVQAADCVPLLFVDRRTGAVAAAHAGWRGMVARVPRAAIAAMAREFSTRAIDLLVVAGPSIGACCYKVGRDVLDAFLAAGFAEADLRRWFFDRPQGSQDNPSMPLGPRRPDHYFFDGWGATRASLEAEGVPAEQIFMASVCTASHPDVLPSYRRDGVRAGRLAAAISARRP